MPPIDTTALVPHFAAILTHCGFADSDPNLMDTPARMAKMYKELLYGHTGDAETEIRTIVAKVFPSENDEMILVRNIQTTGLCPHHFLPVSYKITVAYVSNGLVIGLSKIPRLVDILCKRAVIQESLTSDIATILMQGLRPSGVAVHVVGVHACAALRGVKALNSDMVTTCLLGCLKNTESKNEFLHML